MQVNKRAVRDAARTAATAGDAVPTELLRDAGGEMAVAVAGSAAAAAFVEFADALVPRLTALRTAVTECADDVEAAVTSYEEVDAFTGDRLTRMDWQPS